MENVLVESEDAEEGSYCLLPDHVDKEKMDSRDPEDSVTREEDKSESELFASGSDKQLDSNTGMGNESTSPDNTTVCGGEPSLGRCTKLTNLQGNNNTSH